MGNSEKSLVDSGDNEKSEWMKNKYIFQLDILNMGNMMMDCVAKFITISDKICIYQAI